MRAIAIVALFWACGSGSPQKAQGQVSITAQLSNADSVNYHGSIQARAANGGWVDTSTFRGSAQGTLNYVGACDDRFADDTDDGRVTFTVDSVVVGGGVRGIADGSGIGAAEFNCRAGADARVNLTVRVDLGTADKGFVDISVVFDVVGTGLAIKCDCESGFFNDTDAAVCAYADQPGSLAYLHANLFMWHALAFGPGDVAPFGPPQFSAGTMNDGTLFNAAALPIGTINLTDPNPGFAITMLGMPLTLSEGVHHATSGVISRAGISVTPGTSPTCTGVSCCMAPTPASFQVLYAHVNGKSHEALIVFADDESRPGFEVHFDSTVRSVTAMTDGSVTRSFVDRFILDLPGRIVRACGTDASGFDAITSGSSAGRFRCTLSPGGDYACAPLTDTTCLDG